MNHKKNVIRRLSAIVLAFLLVLQCMSVTAYADDTTTPPTPPDGSAPGDGTAPGGGPGNGSSEEGSTALTSTYTVNGKTVTYSGSSTLSSTTSGQNVVLAKNSGTLSMSGVTLKKTGDDTNSDDTDFYGVNAVVASKSKSCVYLSNSTINSAAQGANCLFASGTNSKIYAKNVTIHSTKNNSRGVDATYNGTVVGSKLSVTTAGDHCAALATDRGNGYVSVLNSTLNTSGNGSPLIYSTGTIEVSNVTGEATGSQIVGMEGLNCVRIANSTLTGANAKASEPVYNGIIIYQSTSGDSTSGTAQFQASDSTLTSHITTGSMFYITNTTAQIVLKNTTLNFDSDNCDLIYAAGNDGSNGWGTSGSNGANVTATAIDETLSGNVLCDGISSVDYYLTDGTTWNGTVTNDTTYTGTGEGVSIYVSKDSTWNVTSACRVANLYVEEGGTVNGLANVTVTGSNTTWDGTGGGTVSTNTISRTAFNSYYSASSLHQCVISSLANSASQTLKIKLANKISAANGYQISFWVKGNKTATLKTVVKTSITSTIKGLTKGKTYLVKVRAYKTSSGKKTYGTWSETKTIKIVK